LKPAQRIHLFTLLKGFSTLNIVNWNKSAPASYPTMASMIRRAPTAFAARALVASRSGARQFSSTPVAFVNVGTSIPDVEVQEGSPGNKVSLAKELAKGKGVIVGVPAAFSTH
jgi:hypothetical protein